jgi:flagellar biogenesis protein FliO
VTVTPADVYTLLVALIVVLVFFAAWCFDRIAEGRKREEEMQKEITALRRRTVPEQREWLA